MFLALAVAAIARAETKIAVNHNDADHATAAFTFKDVPTPAKTSAASSAKFTIVDGVRDDNGAEIDALHDGKLPAESDEPEANFFFDAGTEGGRILVDLGHVITIKEFNTYSWHTDTRAPQVYKLYASDGQAKGFDAAAIPKTPGRLWAVGWHAVATVDTRPKQGEPGGQYGVSISDSNGTLGKFRYLLLEISRTEADDAFGNTFFSEINVVETTTAATTAPADVLTIKAGDGKYQVTIDTTETPDLTEWADKELAPVVKEWYPKIVAMLPSEGYEAPTKFSITFNKDMQGVAYTQGTSIHGAADWYRNNLKTEAKGSIVHEMVHVVQQYGHAHPATTRPSRPPGWLVEGIPDYIRWYLYEPDSHGADLAGRNLIRAHFDGSYRVSANFLNYVATKYDKDLIEKLNVALREGTYESAIWKKLTGKDLDDLNDEWKMSLAKKE
jgi:hypothetical protein